MKKYHLSQKIQVVDTIPTLIGSVCPTWLLPPNYTSVPVLPIDNEAAIYRIMQVPARNIKISREIEVRLVSAFARHV